MKKLLLLAVVVAGVLMAGGRAGAGEVTTSTRARLVGVSHVALKVADIQKSRAFYKEFLGFAEAGELKKDDGSLALVFIKVNDKQGLELFPGRKPEETMLYQVAFEVTGIEALRAQLAARGFKVPARVAKGRIGNLNFTVTDPNGHTIEFVQYEPEGWTMRDAGKFMPATRIATRMRHAGFAVTAPAATMDFYGKTLGMQETWRGSSNDKDLSWINLKLPEGDDYVELMLGQGPFAPDQLGTKNHISLEVDDIEAAVAKLEKSAYWPQYNRKVEIKTGRNRKRQVNLYDPDGTRVEMMEGRTVDGQPAPSAKLPLPAEALDGPSEKLNAKTAN